TSAAAASAAETTAAAAAAATSAAAADRLLSAAHAAHAAAHTAAAAAELRHRFRHANEGVRHADVDSVIGSVGDDDFALGRVARDELGVDFALLHGLEQIHFWRHAGRRLHGRFGHGRRPRSAEFGDEE